MKDSRRVNNTILALMLFLLIPLFITDVPNKLFPAIALAVSLYLFFFDGFFKVQSKEDKLRYIIILILFSHSYFDSEIILPITVIIIFMMTCLLVYWYWNKPGVSNINV